MDNSGDTTRSAAPSPDDVLRYFKSCMADAWKRGDYATLSEALSCLSPPPSATPSRSSQAVPVDAALQLADAAVSASFF